MQLELRNAEGDGVSVTGSRVGAARRGAAQDVEASALDAVEALGITKSRCAEQRRVQTLQGRHSVAVLCCEKVRCKRQEKGLEGLPLVGRPGLPWGPLLGAACGMWETQAHDEATD